MDKTMDSSVDPVYVADIRNSLILPPQNANKSYNIYLFCIKKSLVFYYDDNITII